MGKCLRITFGVLNLLVFLGGIVLLSLALWLHFSEDSLYKFVDSVGETRNNTEANEKFDDVLAIIDASVYLAMAVGGFMILVGFIGFMGACKESSCLLNTFAIIMILLILAEIAVTIVAFVEYPVFSAFMNDDLFKKYQFDETKIAANPADGFSNSVVDLIQPTLRCCGWNDETYVAIDNSTTVIYPGSCCVEENDTADCLIPAFESTCESRFKKLGLIIGGIGAGALVLELLATVCACCIKRKGKKYG